MKSKQKYTPVRFLHLTSYASIGAIVRGVEDKLMVVRDIRNWTDKFGKNSAEIIPYVTRICLALGIDKELRLPPIAKETDKGDIQGSYLSAVLFPTYGVCQRCGALHNNPWKKQQVDFTDKVKCEKCEENLEQVTWCAVSNKGYLDDVPWHFVSHLKSDRTCRVDFDDTYLKLVTKPNGKRVVKCSRCGSEEYYENRPINIINKQQPWIFGETVDLDKDDIVEILEVNSPSVYLPERSNAIVIPPESRISKSSIIDKLYNNSKVCREIENIKIPLRKKAKIKEVASQFRCHIDDIKSALIEIKSGYPFLESNITVGELMEDEYKALLTPLEDVADDEDFVTVHKTEDWKKLDDQPLSAELLSIIKVVDQQIIASRLREIQVFKGFYRVSQEDNDNLVPPDIVGESNWLPAIELFGEGVFFTLDEQILKQWEKIDGVKKRTDEIAKRYENSDFNLQKDIVISPRFLLLHTISHLLIRELEITAGYPAASLKERIYCSQDSKMAGVLIYTVVADIVGSLGGIVESGESKEFLGLMSNVFKHAQWCSLDPVCTEHEGQGPSWLNRAACHACALIPEPSCEFGNVFLDRVFIKGSESVGVPSFLDFVMEIENGKQEV